MNETWSWADEKQVHEDTMASLAEVLGRPVTSVAQLTQQEPELRALLAPEERAVLQAKWDGEVAAYKAVHDEMRRKIREYMQGGGR